MADDNSAEDPDRSVTGIIQRLKSDDPAAAGEIWQRFFARLLPLARARLQPLADRSVDEEDILISVFDRFFRAARENRFARLEDRDDLWQILLMLTERRVAEQFRRSGAQKRGGGLVRQLGDLNNGSGQIPELSDLELDPEFIAAFNDSVAGALARLADTTARHVALMKLEGFENNEIARQLNISRTTVERKLRVIRALWSDMFAQ